MKKKLFVVVVLAAFMLLASLSTSMAGYVHGFDKETDGLNRYVLLTSGQRQDYPSTKATVSVREFVGYNPSGGSISFFCKIEANIGDKWLQVTDATRCWAAERGEYQASTRLNYYADRIIPNGIQLRAYGRSGQYYAGEPMRGFINFN